MIEHPVTFGRLLDTHRRIAGMSQNALARLSGIDPAYVNRLIHAENSAPTRRVVMELTVSLGLDSYAADRLLFVAGHAPEHDWQAIALDYARRLQHVDAALIGMAALPTRHGEIAEEATA